MKTLREKDDELIALVGREKARNMLNSWYDRVIKRERKRGQGQVQEDVVEFCRKVLEDLHKRTGITYRLGKEVKSWIIARRNDGFSFEDFQHVHEIKVFHWLEDPQWSAYLHPSTLYRPTKFDKYLAQWQMRERDLRQKKQKELAKKQKQSEEKKEKEQPVSEEEAARYRSIISKTVGKIKKKIPQPEMEIV